MLLRASWIALLLGFLTPGLALAQEEEPGDEVEMTDDEPEPEDDFMFGDEGSPSGSDETPGDPSSVYSANQTPADPVSTPVLERGPYPSEVIIRPLTLPSGMIEIGLDVPVRVEPFSTSGTLRADYGVTSELQLGLRWGAGTVYEDGFEYGEALSLDAYYLLTDWASLQLSVPFYIDPFALGVTLGAPLRFTLFDRFALVTGADLLSFKIHRFVPVLDNELENEVFVELDRTNTTISCCAVNVLAQGIYQLDEMSAIDLRFLLRKNLETSPGIPSDSAVELDVGYLYATSNLLDFGARIGFEDMSDPGESFRAIVFSALRL